MLRSSLAAAVALLLLVACGPVGSLPGGPLTGKVHEGAVTDWRFTDSVKDAQLETNPADPYSVNVWCAQAGGKLYVPTAMGSGDEHPGERQWVRNLTLDPNVRVKLGDEIYLLRAERVTDPAEFETAKSALLKKYAMDRREIDPGREIWIFRLDARS